MTALRGGRFGIFPKNLFIGCFVDVREIHDYIKCHLADALIQSNFQ